MTTDQTILFAILFVTLSLFIYGRWRHDLVAIIALILATLTGIVSSKDAFLGFTNPAVITVAFVLIISAGLKNAGLVDFLSHYLLRPNLSKQSQGFLLNSLIASISGFMNNVGALGIMLPVTLKIVKKLEASPSLFLIPLAFSSLLGGMITLIGTPSNIIVAALRVNTGFPPFSMFDFFPVGIGIAVVGVLYLSFIGWRFLPTRLGQATAEELFEIDSYTMELKVPPKAKLVGKTVGEFNEEFEEDVILLAIVRGKRKITSFGKNNKINEEDILIIEADHESVQKLVDHTGIELVEKTSEKTTIGELAMIEAIIRPGSKMVDRKVSSLKLIENMGVQIVAVAREGKRVNKRLSQLPLKAGDVILLRGPEQPVFEVIQQMDCFPLIERNLRLGKPRKILLSTLIFALAILATTFNILPIEISFLICIVAMYFTGFIKLREIYNSIDWSIIVLLGALIPVGKALETTGGANLIAEKIIQIGPDYPTLLLTILLVTTMLLSDVVNNATAAILMVPIAIKIAAQLGVSTDPFLMATAIGASSPFLTPIGHQSNTLVLGPGGYHFSDYARVGAPLDILIILIAIPLLRIFWPF